MSRALQLARRGLYSTHPNPRVGCVLVRDGRIIGEGWHEIAGGPHAEVNAINNAQADSAGASCYVTLEPCSHTGRTPPCVDALIEAGIEKVIAAMPDPNPLVAGEGLSRLEQAGIETAVGLLQQQAEELNAGYIMRMTQQRPFVRCKLAMSLDGRTALTSGDSKWITGTAARQDVQRLRAQSSAIITGIGTVLTDNPGLNVREVETQGRQPLRVVIDPQLKFPVTAKMLQLPGRTLIFTGSDNNPAIPELHQAGAEIIIVKQPKTHFLKQVLTDLAQREQVNEVLVEAGANLAGSLLSSGLIDELVLYQAPVIIGDDAWGLFHLPPLKRMEERIQFEVLDRRSVGDDWRIKLKVKS